MMLDTCKSVGINGMGVRRRSCEEINEEEFEER